MKYRLMAVFERENGTIFYQNVKYVSEEESYNHELMLQLIREYKRMLGKDYLLVDWYIA